MTDIILAAKILAVMLPILGLCLTVALLCACRLNASKPSPRPTFRETP